MTRRVLVVSATAAEAAHVPTDLPLVVTGMGKVAAATALWFGFGHTLEYLVYASLFQRKRRNDQHSSHQ